MHTTFLAEIGPDNSSRPRRQAAIKQRRLLENLVADAALRIETKKPVMFQGVPTHGFDYQEWLALLNDDEPYLRKPRCVSSSSSGLESLRATLLIRNIDPDPCVVEVLDMVHDYIDSHTICARLEMAAIKIQTWFRKISARRLNTAVTTIQKWFRGIVLKRSLTQYLGPALDVVHAVQDLGQDVVSSSRPRRSGRLRMQNPDVAGDIWMQ